MYIDIGNMSIQVVLFWGKGGTIPFGGDEEGDRTGSRNISHIQYYIYSQLFIRYIKLYMYNIYCYVYIYEPPNKIEY